ncbi:MAG: hypothetical protein JO269_03520, partial [Burkholderiaceae bacterium]|nr:hypothetical protein [Burkholderiaceae bacterium]
MKNKLLSLWIWRAVLIMLAMVVFIFGVWASSYWERATPAKAGTLAATFGPGDAELRKAILAMEPDSPLLQAGAKLGDKVKFDRKIVELGPFHHIGTDESIGLTLFSGSLVTHLSIQPVPDQEIQRHAVANEVFVALSAAVGFLA